jgi:hypothetical protein
MNLKLAKPSTQPEKQTRSTMDTLELNPKLVASWKSPPFQRGLKINTKVMNVVDEIRKDGGVLPGVITIGVLEGETYVVDGQHRLAAWLQTGMPVGYADVRTHWFTTLGEMADEFVRINTPLVKLRPDDILRGMEPSSPALQRIRSKCGYIGYDVVRRGHHTPVLSMSVFLRCWVGSRNEVPSPESSTTAASMMDDPETTAAISFVGVCFEAWARDVEYAKLWGALNLSLCAWLFRRSVLGQHAHANTRIDRMTMEQFKRCLMSLSADSGYLDYLVGRNLGDRDRSPAYHRIKTIFARRFATDGNQKFRLPTPPWAANSGIKRQ